MEQRKSWHSPEAKEVEEAKEMTERVGAVRTYSDLLVYKQAYRLALDVSTQTKRFPRAE